MKQRYNYLDDDLSDIGGPPVPSTKAAVIVMPSPKQPTHPLDMPADCMCGWLGDHARSLDAPLGWAYTSLLTVFASQGVNLNDEHPQVRPTLYTVLVGAPEDGKSTVMRRAIRSLNLDPSTVKVTVPGSDRGLQRIFAPPASAGKKGPAEEPHQLKSYLLSQDEFRNTLSKIGIQGSSLATTLCSLFYDDEAGSADKTGVHNVFARINILGALACADRDEFMQMFGAETLAGLYSRMLVVPGPTNWRWDHTWLPDTALRKPSPVDVPPHCFQVTDAWRDAAPEKKRGRIGEIALRIAVISASASHEREVSPACMAAALRFAEWQERVKSVYCASEAMNPDAVITSSILDAFTEHDKDNPGDWVKFWDVARTKNWARKWGSSVTRAKQSLINDGYLIEETDEDEHGNIKRSRSGRLKLRTC